MDKRMAVEEQGEAEVFGEAECTCKGIYSGHLVHARSVIGNQHPELNTSEVWR